MRRPFALVLILASVLFLSACTAISYKPALSLGAHFADREHVDRSIMNSQIGHRERSEATLGVR